MNRLPVFLLIFMMIASLAWVTGCRSPQAPASGIGEISNRQQSPDVNDEYGGYNTRDESTGFGDEEMLGEFAEDQVYDDPFATDAPELGSVSDHGLFLMITWGNLHRDAAIAHLTDWSGSLSIDPGAIVLKRTIRFEANDRIIPRTQREVLAWESTTGWGMDGILVRIIPRLSDTSVDVAVDPENTIITFQTDPVKVDFTLAQLPGLHRVITLDDGNAVAFSAVKLPPVPCPHGFLRGAWHNNPERPGGEFFGRWATADGEIKGFLKGIYGVNDDGQKVFFGKMIDRTGRFQGIMRGRWGNHPADEHGGWFAGHWVDRNLMIEGGLKGEWHRSPHCNGGFFRGMWAKNCEGTI